MEKTRSEVNEGTMSVGDTCDDERETITDRVTAMKYVRMTRTSRNKHLYLYVNSYDKSGRLIFCSERDGYLNYYRMDLDTGIATQLTAETEIAAAGLAWHSPAHLVLLYWAGRRIRMLNLDTLECRSVVEYPRYGGYLTLTADGEHILTYYDMGDTEDKPGGKNPVGPWGIFAIPTDPEGPSETPSGSLVFETPNRVNHIQASPTDPDLIEFCWEGPWEKLPQRVWSTNLSGTAGGPFGRQRPNEARGHEFWFADGSMMGYHGRTGLQGQQVHMIGTVTAGGVDAWQARLAERCGHCMYHAGRDLWVTDRAGEDNTIAFIHPEGDGTIARLEHLCDHNSSWKSQGCHPHMQFSPDGGRLVWTSDGEGVSQVYAMDI
jgi:oligogalacturonide lyase